MHDVLELERLGTPAGFIASTEFIQAARAQGKALGYDAAAVFVPHPIQDRSDEEIAGLAQAAWPEIRALLCRGPAAK